MCTCSLVLKEPDVNAGMWWVEPDFGAKGEALYAVIHIDTMIHAAHLIGKPGGPLSTSITYISTPDMFDTFYVNKYLDPHVYKFALTIDSSTHIIIHIPPHNPYNTTMFPSLIYSCLQGQT